jgi:hypothetical protein
LLIHRRLAGRSNDNRIYSHHVRLHVLRQGRHCPGYPVRSSEGGSAHRYRELYRRPARLEAPRTCGGTWRGNREIPCLPGGTCPRRVVSPSTSPTIGDQEVGWTHSAGEGSEQEWTTGGGGNGSTTGNQPR